MAKFSPFSSSIVYSGVTKDKPIAASYNNTDVVAPEFKVYIEGIEVPWDSINVSQTYGSLPVASVAIPPSAGLMDIIRGYRPKVHVFFRDNNYGGLRLLFWGHTSSAYYSVDRETGSASIYFQCTHKNAMLDSFTLDYTGWVSENAPSQVDPNSETQGAGVKITAFNSLQTAITALEGIVGVASKSEEITAANGGTEGKAASLPTNKLPSSLEPSKDRLVGMAGVLVNLWNVAKRSAAADPKSNLAAWGMWFPLIEEGLGYFKRMSGHPLLEKRLQASTQPYCIRGSNKNQNIITPPYFRTSAISAQSREIAVRAIYQGMNFSGELTTMSQMMSMFMDICQYDMLTLSSPAEIPADPDIYTPNPTQKDSLPKVAVETIVKPRIQAYFSPICNVLFPRMYSSLRVSQDESMVPTRVGATFKFLPQADSGVSGVNFRGPSPVREAVSYNQFLRNSTPKMFDLTSTKGWSFSIPSTYEQGDGIRPEKIAPPFWLSMVIGDKAETSSGAKTEETMDKSSAEYNSAMLLAKEWSTRYAVDIFMEDGVIKITPNPAKEGLNIHNLTTPGMAAYERLMYATSDYEFVQRVASSRTGEVTCPFNPYIIPGYPMDVISELPDAPSFHGFCTSVSHSITSRSVSTTVGMTSPMTYAELSNYRVPASSPYLMASLDIINGDINTSVRDSKPVGDLSAYSNVKSGLLQNPVAKQTADLFYQQVLGVGAVAPDDLMHFSSGRAYQLDRVNSVLVPRVKEKTSAAPAYSSSDFHGMDKNGRIADDNMSYVGNLRLVARPIESKDSIESKFSWSFVDMTVENYNNTFINYLNPALKSDFLIEPGASMFLDYMETSEFIKALKL